MTPSSICGSCWSPCAPSELAPSCPRCGYELCVADTELPFTVTPAAPGSRAGRAQHADGTLVLPATDPVCTCATCSRPGAPDADFPACSRCGGSMWIGAAGGVQ